MEGCKWTKQTELLQNPAKGRNMSGAFVDYIIRERWRHPSGHQVKTERVASVLETYQLWPVGFLILRVEIYIPILQSTGMFFPPYMPFFPLGINSLYPLPLLTLPLSSFIPSLKRLINVSSQWFRGRVIGDTYRSIGRWNTKSAKLSVPECCCSHDLCIRYIPNIRYGGGTHLDGFPSHDPKHFIHPQPLCLPWVFPQCHI